VKRRLRAGNHPVARIDTGGRPGRIGPIPERAGSAIAEAAAILVADYGNGTTSDDRLRTLIGDALLKSPVIWDPHPKGAPALPGTTLVIPNETELLGFVGQPVDGSLTSIRRAAAQFADQWRAAAVCVTIGSRGALLFFGDGAPQLAAGTAVTGTDTCGAGDSFAAAVTAALADGDLPSEAVSKAVAAASRFVAGGGAATFDPGRPSAGLPEPDLTSRLQRVREAGGVVVATGGCFDLIHAGHVATLEAARALGDILVVCLNSDESVRRLKGAQRPLQPVHDRARVLLALRSVDAVVVFDEDTPVEALRQIRPSVWVKGGDYSGMALPEAAIVSDWGGEVLTVPYVPGKSTSDIVSLAAESTQR
jgi:rfaE bifunctional protein nucleotidyltransferase chain/domain